MTDFFQGLDWSVLHWIQGTLRCGILDFLMPKLSMLGDLGAVWVLTAVLMLFARKYRLCGAMILAGLAVCFLAGSLVLKPLIARPRPCWLDAGAKLLIPMERDYSFPSGHTMSSFASAAVLFRQSRRLGIFSFALAALIGFSRLYLFVHFPSDVLSGALLGVLIGFLVFRAGQRIRNAQRSAG